MSELKNLSAILEGGAVPAGYNGKAIGKLSKTYLKLENRKVVNLYPIRTVMHEDSRYCLYACPLKGTEIDEATLQSIKAEVDTLEIGEIRYDSVQSCGYDYYIVDPDTGRHILTGIIRKSKFPQNPKRSVRFSGKGTKRSVQKKESAQHSKSRNKRFVITSVSAL